LQAYRRTQKDARANYTEKSLELHSKNKGVLD
jgi:hypothetical protein